MKKALTYGILASVFFSFTFVLNKSMNISGGNWMWSASLRYIFMLPILLLIVLKNNRLNVIFNSIKRNPKYWILWSTVGFGLFYAPLTFASNYGESWLVAGCWQITIVAGILLTPIFKSKLPLKNLFLSLFILFGVFLIQYEHAKNINITQALLSIIPILIAAFSYPLGNRKMMMLCEDDLSTTERVFGMTLCSLPFWLILSLVAYKNVGLPSTNQMFQSFSVAIFSGVIATILFFKATNMVKHNFNQLAVIEATQSAEVLFTIIGEVIILNGAIPSFNGLIGLALIILGMILNSLIS
ncbi:multidrug resistance efflux transporter family protein [Clostridium sp. Ade.TY]|uniref:DMT family transporter n=1 Tax=Clostridium sp. Ade.TY TaxID=1391647 RepID=UPI000427491A|nr:multidrug resistance efflux transporter family protein [Clostridium sp. Ade.TY]